MEPSILNNSSSNDQKFVAATPGAQFPAGIAGDTTREASNLAAASAAAAMNHTHTHFPSVAIGANTQSGESSAFKTQRPKGIERNPVTQFSEEGEFALGPPTQEQPRAAKPFRHPKLSEGENLLGPVNTEGSHEHTSSPRERDLAPGAGLEVSLMKASKAKVKGSLKKKHRFQSVSTVKRQEAKQQLMTNYHEFMLNRKGSNSICSSGSARRFTGGQDSLPQIAQRFNQTLPQGFGVEPSESVNTRYVKHVSHMFDQYQ